jgi:hypothetical protein
MKTAESRQEQFEPIIHELVQRDVKVLFVAGHSIVRMAKQATTMIPARIVQARRELRRNPDIAGHRSRAARRPSRAPTERRLLDITP